ncbi:hypothetical protein [Syntrophomonas wolfei]|uniref:hypothetical protein n=1 Tax=Syntrophomonas wolfei TaxID=863 RepID=UPI0007740E39|nr:hypothetical protein [Syntrophomonas wolfei]
MSKGRILGGILLILLLLFNSGCNFEGKRLFQSSSAPEEQLIKVRIVFTDDQELETYIKNLGIDEKGKVYVGGSSLSYFYDANGKVLGSYNYQRVLYIEIIPEKNKEK